MGAACSGKQKQSRFDDEINSSTEMHQKTKTENERLDNLLEQKTETFKNEYYVAQNERVQLGSGRFGKVWRSRDVIKAVKTMEFLSMDQGAKLSVLRELSILKAANHTHVDKLYYCTTNVNLTRMHFVMDAVDMTLNDYIKSHKMSHDLLMKMSYQFFLGLSYLNSSNIVHRDIQPDNIGFLTGDLKILDFGMARVENTTYMTMRRGTLQYTAPEALLSSKYNKNVDVWSFGCVLAAITKRIPFMFSSGNRKELLGRIFSTRGSSPQSFQESLVQFENYQDWLGLPAIDVDQLFSDSLLHPDLSVNNALNNLLRGFLDKMLTVDPSLRYDARLMINDPYLQSFFNQEDVNFIVAFTIKKYTMENASAVEVKKLFVE